MNKIIYILIVILLGVSTVHAQYPRDQQLQAAEYFLNADPGQGNGTSITITTSPDVTINLNNLNVPVGTKIYVRFQSTNSFWSAPRCIQRYDYFVATGALLQYGEYFINNDPGYGNATPITFSSGIANLNNQNLHQDDVVYFRIRDSYNRWSPARGFHYQYKDMRQAEYRIKLAATGQYTTPVPFNVTAAADTTCPFTGIKNNIALGTNDTIYVRYQSMEGFYSSWRRGIIAKACNDKTICEGNDATLTASGGSSYQWSNSMAGSSIIVTPATTTTYTVTVSDGAGAWSVDSVTVFVTNTPAIATIPAGSDTICQGSASVNYTTLGSTGATSYVWEIVPSSAGTISGTGTTATVNWDVLFTGQASIKVKGVNTCFTGSFSPAFIITVLASPVADAVPDQGVCQGTSVTLTASGGISYLWNNGITNGITFIPSATTTYTVTVSDISGCTDTDDAIITVYTPPVANAGSDINVCAGNSVTLTATGGTSYLWDNGIVNNASFTPGSTATYHVTVTDVNNCTGTDSVSVTVLPIPIPTANAGSDQTVCSATPVTLTATGGTSYSWDNGVINGTPFIPTSSSVYTVTVTGSNGCTSMDNVTVTVDPATVPGTVNGTTSICEGYSTGMLTLTGNTGAVVKWQKRLNSGSWTDISNNTGFYSEIPASTGTWSYRAVVQSGVCNADFSTPAVITVSSLSVGGSISGSATICEGLPTGTLILSGYNGSIIKWRKRLNSGSWMDISNTSVVYNEIPDTSGIWDYQAIVQNSACDLDSSAIVSVIVNPIPIADAGADQIVCSGSSVTLAGSGGLYYSWNNSVTNGIPFVPATTGTYTVTVTNSYGCTSTDNMVVTVNSLPVANAGADQSVCAGQSITLCANGGNTYQWDNSVTNCVQFTPVATVTYHVTVTDANNCSATDNVLVTVNSLPTANAGSDQTVCEGTSVTLSATGGTSYNWDNGVINGIAFTPTTTTTYTVTVTNADNCTATDSVIITVNPLPAAAGVITGSAIVCQNQTSVVYSIPVISNAVAYVWTLPSGFSGTSNSNTVTVNIDVSAVSGSITVKGQNTCGFGTISTLAVTVNPLPLAAGSISGASTVCQGQNSVLYSLPSVTNATSYNWTLPTGATGSSTTNSISLNFGTSAITDNITVKGTNTCGSGASSQMLITVNQLPVPAGIISGVSSVCQGQSNVDYTVPLITNANTYVWSLPSGVSGTSSTNNITVSFGFNAQSGNVTVKGQNACGDGQISILPITVNPVPITPVITQNGSILQSDAINGNQWYMNNAIIPGATGQNYTPSQNGNYFVIVTSTYGCSSDTSNILQFNTGIEEILQAGSFKVFPNPNQGTFNVQFDLNQTQEISIVILDFLGKEIYSEKSQKQNGKLDRSIDLSNSAAGIYTLILKIGDNQLIEKLSIIK